MLKVQEQSRLFREILLALFDDAQRNQSTKITIADIPPELSIGANCFYDRRTMEAHLPSPNGKERICGGFKSLFLILKVVENGAPLLPVISLSFNFGCSIPQITFRVGLFLKHDGITKAIGYRLETPHGIDKSGAGIHHFYHVQMIKSLEGRAFPPKELTEWLPDNEPTFPLDAEDSVELLLCLVLSLYGRDEINNFALLFPPPHTRNQILDKISKLKMANFNKSSLKWYWKGMSKSNTSYVCYETNCLAEEFLKQVRPQHPNYDFIEITPEEWLTHPDGPSKKNYIK